MQKSCHLLGLGYDSVVCVPSDSNARMDINALKSRLEQDKAKGLLPFCIVATVGTTDFGSIDNIEEIKKLSETYNTWLHADAAYGSGLIMSNKYKSAVSDLSLCSSITVDFHKMFLLPISCSAILVKDKNSFEPLSFHADYLNREEDEEDGYTNLVGKSLQTTRRFDALKVWTAFQCRGQDGYEKMINTCVENAQYVYDSLKNNASFEVAIKPEISSIVFRLSPKPSETREQTDIRNKAVRRKLLHKEGIVIGQTVFNGCVFLKFTLLNPLITHEDLDNLLRLIEVAYED